MDHIGALRSQGLSPDHLRTELAGLKQYYKYLVRTGARVDDPSRHIFLKDGQHKDIQFQDLFTPEELDLLLDRPNRYGILQWRNKLIVSFYIYQGLTTGEIERLRVIDVDLDQGSLFILASPRQCARALPLRANQVLFLERYLTFDRPCLLRFDTDALLLSKLGGTVKGEDCHYLIESARDLFPERCLNPITVRQSVIVNLFRKGMDIRDVQLYAGHHYASSTERYRPTDLTTLQNALERFHPLAPR
jgi:integrase/recombinase XerD